MPTVLYQADLPAFIVDLTRSFLPEESLALVSDPATHAASGKNLYDALSLFRSIRHVDLGPAPRATRELFDGLAARLHGVQGIVAVGSGTINDACKYAAHQLKIPYIICPTAPSMNGYTSCTASFADGHKKFSAKVTPPAAVLCDMDVIAAAPIRMMQAGLGDVLCRSTVQTDWMLSARILGTSYDASLFAPLRAIEPDLLRGAEALAVRDPVILRHLMQALIGSGDAMAQSGSSAPASQSEHLIAHAMEVLFPELTHPWLHGEMIAVTTLIAARAQEAWLRRPFRLYDNDVSRSVFVQAFGEDDADSLYASYQNKRVDALQAKAINEVMKSQWPSIVEEIASIRMPATQMEQALKLAGAPTSSSQLGWEKSQLMHAIRHAHLMRDRFTVLDVLAMDDFRLLDALL